MTNEERENAIRCLKMWIEREPQTQTYKICLEALEQDPCDDCISRKRLKECFHRNVVGADAFDTIIDMQPSVQPKPKTNVLDKIRAEIEQTAKDYDMFDDYKCVRGLLIALEIIDKYRKGDKDT